MTPPADPDSYVKGLNGWHRQCVLNLRKEVTFSAELAETVRWGHLVYSTKGPVLLIRAEEQRVLFGFWRGQRLREIEPRLKPGGTYEMATLELRQGDAIAPKIIRKLVNEAVELNNTLGDPTAVVKRRTIGGKPKR